MKIFIYSAAVTLRRLAKFVALFLFCTSALAYNSDEAPLVFGTSLELGYSPAPISGGDNDHSSSKQRITLNLLADLDSLFAWPQASFFIQYQNHHGKHGGEVSRDIQQYDGLDDPEYDRIHMAWYQQLFFDEKLRIKVGKVDVKSEFFAPENARHHFGISTERSPTIIAQGPPAMSFNAFYQASEKLSFGFGIYDAAWAQGRDENVMTLHNPFSYGPDRAIFLEGKYQWQHGLADLPGQLKLGIWQLDSDQTRFDGRVQSNSEGYYLAWDQTLTRSGIGMYLQYGYADKDVSPLVQHLGLGMQWLAPFPQRQQDIFGMGLSYVEFSDAGGAPYSEDHETAFEVFYKSPITDWFTLQGDLQQIVNPGGQGASDVLIASFRATFSY